MQTISSMERTLGKNAYDPDGSKAWKQKFLDKYTEEMDLITKTKNDFTNLSNALILSSPKIQILARYITRCDRLIMKIQQLFDMLDNY